MNNALIILAFVALSISGCLNRFEKQMVGRYTVASYSLRNSRGSINAPELTLSADKTFIIKTKRKEVKGAWNAYDDGDFTLLSIESEKRKDQARIYGLKDTVILSFSAPDNFFFIDDFKEIKFIKQSLTKNN